MTPVARFYKSVDVAEANGAFVVRLDGKPLKTPARAVLASSSRALADAIAAEWRGQGQTLDSASMPLTRLAFAAQHAGAIRDRLEQEIIAFGRSDLLCYRAEAPAALVARQAGAWDPLLAWAEERLGAKLAVGSGIAYVEQSPDSQAALAAAAKTRDTSALVALHGATAITGSLVLALALLQGRLGAAEAFALSRLDEAFQTEAWGRDAEAEARAGRLAAELAAIERFLRLARP
jgi:chaperone required for assembly of F1-ATPase